MAEYFETAVNAGGNAKLVANWVTQDIAAYLNNNHLIITEIPLKPEALAELVQLIEKGTISGKIAREILPELLEKGGSPKKIIESKGMTQISDPVELGKIVDEIIAAHPKELEKFRSGKGNMKGFLCWSNYEANGGTY